MAIACLRLLTFWALRPLLSVPLLRFFMARSTSFKTPFEYLRAILLPLKPTIMAVVANAIGPMLVTIVCETLFRGRSLNPLEELR